MKIVFFFTGVFFCLLSCKTQSYVSDNTHYNTPPEIGVVTTDLPLKSTYMHVAGIENTTENNPSNNQKSKDKTSLPPAPEKDTITIPKKEIPDIQPKTEQKKISTDSSSTVAKNNAISNKEDKQEDKEIVKNTKPTDKDKKELPENKTTDNENVSVKNLNVSDFSWEVGIKITQILDVRTLKEFKSGHIYDAINMDVNNPSFVNQIQTLDKTSPVAVYSQHGKRSMEAINILKQYGFEIIYNLNDGLAQWIKEKKEIFR